MLRSDLVKLLNERRDNDVRIVVPTASGTVYTLDVAGVGYDPGDIATPDCIQVHTTELVDRDPDEPPTAPLPAAGNTDPDVWMSIARRGVDYHAPRGDGSTRCGRHVASEGRTYGIVLNRSIARDRFQSEPCWRCYPDGELR